MTKIVLSEANLDAVSRFVCVDGTRIDLDEVALYLLHGDGDTLLVLKSGYEMVVQVPCEFFDELFLVKPMVMAAQEPPPSSFAEPPREEVSSFAEVSVETAIFGAEPQLVEEQPSEKSEHEQKRVGYDPWIYRSYDYVEDIVFGLSKMGLSRMEERQEAYRRLKAVDDFDLDKMPDTFRSWSAAKAFDKIVDFYYPWPNTPVHPEEIREVVEANQAIAVPNPDQAVMDWSVEKARAAISAIDRLFGRDAYDVTPFENHIRACGFDPPAPRGFAPPAPPERKPESDPGFDENTSPELLELLPPLVDPK